MCYLRLSTVLIVLSMTLNCLSTTMANREQSDVRPGRESWLLPGFVKNSFISLTATAPEQEAVKAKRGHMEKRRCNTATCVTQRLADFLVRSSNSIGAVYTPTNVGSNTYGKRAGLAPLSRETLKYIPF
ncbi:islet amyloid polypeptide-like [Acipenser oxyrinchus oxyrinchus]|uniref:Islet amyloid polypeptide-like n=1 Tax=Acipenser oxyrinchus oxyrinchus TaxID=40147 RepID=A0AAD8DJ62_ACIOX|nr:islet amyloid polypeptide-like [Acipenser oxyrinchus oxyrinchus]